MNKLLRCASMLFLLACMPILSNGQCTVNAGADYNRCVYRTDSTVLHGTAAGNFVTYSWTTSGSGTFNKSNTLNPEYFQTAADIAGGSVTFTFTASGGTCGSVTDQIVVTFYKLPTVTLQDEFTICNGVLNIPLTSTVVGSSTLHWYSIVGSGTFSSTTTTNTTYSATIADSSRGYVLLTLQGSTPASSCIGSDTVRVNIVPNTGINLGADETICVAPDKKINTPVIALGYTSYVWTTSGTGTFEDPGAIGSAYTLSAADIASGSVTLTLTGNNPTCGTFSDSRTITILPTITVSAGIDQTVCGATNTVALSGTVTASSSTTIQWFNVVGSGTFSNNSTLTPIYTIDAADKTRGYALVRLRAISAEGCVKEDTVALNILSAPFVSAGANKLSCSGPVALSGASFGATSKTWTTTGTGTFANQNKDTTTYTPSGVDRSVGFVILTYSVVNACSTLRSTAKIDFISGVQPQVSAGADVSICANDTVKLLGTVVNAAGGTWSTTGSGTFFSSTSHLINQYKLSAADKVAGTIVFTLTSYNSGGCGAVSDQKTVTIAAGSVPTVNVGSDQNSAVSTSLSATVSNASSQLWETSGTGLFVPNPTSVNTSYLPSADDIAAESVVLTLVATGTCGTASDALTLYTGSPSSIKGTVKAGTNVLDNGVVYLFSSSNNTPGTLAGIDTIFSSDNGQYEFPLVPTGSYLVYAVPSGSVYSATYLATYFGNPAATQWSGAEQEEVANNSAPHILNIDLVAYTSALPTWNTGHDTIAGAILLNIPTPVMRLAGTDDKPLSGTVVYLKTLNGNIIAYTSTDKFGAYTFNNVIAGNYFIDTEYANTEDISADQKIVAVDGNPQTIEDGSVIVYRTALTTGVISSTKFIQVNAYPNPASDVVHIQLPKAGNYSARVLDEVGGLHTEQQLSVTSGQVVDISLANLNKGLYIIQITSGDEVYTTKIVKF